MKVDCKRYCYKCEGHEGPCDCQMPHKWEDYTTCKQAGTYLWRVLCAIAMAFAWPIMSPKNKFTAQPPVKVKPRGSVAEQIPEPPKAQFRRMLICRWNKGGCKYPCGGLSNSRCIEACAKYDHQNKEDCDCMRVHHRPPMPREPPEEKRLWRRK